LGSSAVTRVTSWFVSFSFGYRVGAAQKLALDNRMLVH
jgi:hypothetical protein